MSITYKPGDIVNILNISLVATEVVFEGRSVIKEALRLGNDSYVVEFIGDDLSSPVERFVYKEAQVPDVYEFIEQKTAKLRGGLKLMAETVKQLAGSF